MEWPHKVAAILSRENPDAVWQQGPFEREMGQQVQPSGVGRLAQKTNEVHGGCVQRGTERLVQRADRKRDFDDGNLYGIT